MRALTSRELADYPMFPLGTPLLPGVALPMQIFEPRYLEMIRRQLERDDQANPEFGVVMIERGTETGGDDDRATVACRAVAFNLDWSTRGLVRFAAVGVERLRVVRWLPDDPYPHAVVESWPDLPGPAISDVGLAELGSLIAEVSQLAAQLGDRRLTEAMADGHQSDFELYQIAAAAPIGTLDRYRVLAAPSRDERVTALAEALDDARSVLKFRQIC